MKCEACGFENEQEFSYCPNCGAAAQGSIVETAQPVNTAAEKVLAALKDKLFLALCILMSVSCGVALISTGPNVISILFTIFLWLAYAQARKGIADADHLRRVSGTVYAQYVITNVCAIMLIVIGGILGLCFGALMSDTGFVYELLAGLDLGLEDMEMVSRILASVSGVVIFVVFAFIGAAMLVFNLFSNRYIHRFAKAVYQGVESGKLELKHTNATYKWLWVFGILAGLGLLGNLSSGDILLIASDAASCAMPIIAAALIKKYLIEEV